MKRRWKKFLAGVLSAALALNLAVPLALADGVACRVTKVFVYPDHVGRVNSVNVNCIQGEVSYNQGVLTFDGDVTLTTVGPADTGTISLVEALGEKNLRLVANGKVTGRTKSNGFDGAKEIVRGEYDLSNTDAGNQSKGILGATNDKTTIASDTRITLKGFQTGIGWGSVQIDGKVKITNAECGIANFTTMNHGSELVIHAQQYIGEQGHLTYNGGHLLLNVTTIGMDFGLSRLGIGKDVSRFWYRTDDDAGYTEIDTSVQEKLDSFFEVKETNHAYLELTDVDPDQQESETYALLVAGTQVTKSNQNDVLGNGTVAYDPNTHTLTLKQADLTLSGDAEEGIYCCIQSELADMLTITGTATLSDADGIMTAGPLTLDNATLTLTGESGDGVEDAIRAGRSDEDITIENSKVTIAGTNSEGNFFQFGIRCGKLTVANSTLDVKADGSAIVAADEMEVSGAGTVITAETDASEEQDYYALELGRLIMSHGLDLVEGKMNESKKAKIAQPEQAPTDFKVYWVVHPGDEPVNGGMQFPGAITGSEEEARLFEGWFLEDGTRLENSPYYMGPGANHVGNLDRDVTFYGHWRTAESGEGSPDGGDGFGTLLAVGAVVGVAGVVAYQVGTELILDQLLPAGVAVPHTRAELAMLLWNTAGRPAPATLPAFADVADPELAQAAQWAIEQGYLKARADGSFKPDKGVAKWRVIRGYRAVTEP
jgi:archaellum component FlaF (FlaF/FlaG flagellin family)